MTTPNRIIKIAIAAEVIVIAAGLTFAAVQGTAAFEHHGSFVMLASGAALPVLLAGLEALKIPAAIGLYKARWWLKPAALALLVAGAFATMETVTMAGSTWFRSLQHEITVAQTDLTAMRERADRGAGEDIRISNIEKAIKLVDQQIAAVEGGPPVVVAARKRVEEVGFEIERMTAKITQARTTFGAAWDEQTANNQERLKSTDPIVRREAERSQRTLPTRSIYVEARMRSWWASEGRSVRRALTRLERERETALATLNDARANSTGRDESALQQLYSEKAKLRDDLNGVISAVRVDHDARAELLQQIERQKLVVAALARRSVVYDIASKVYAVPGHEVTEEQANVVTFWLLTIAAVAIAIGTSLAAFVATHLAHLDTDRRDPARRRLVRKIRRLKQQLAAMPRVEFKERIVYRHLPIDREIEGGIETLFKKDQYDEAA